MAIAVLVEGLPSVLAGIATLLYLVDTPKQATWLSFEEQAYIARHLDLEEGAKRSEGASAHRFGDAFRSPKVWLLCLAFFGLQMATTDWRFGCRRFSRTA
jgi:sugar phosphate permease